VKRSFSRTTRGTSRAFARIEDSMKRWLASVLLGVGFAACGGSTDLGGTADAGDASDAGVDYDDCTKNSQCIVRPSSCCGQCGAATREDIVALNADKALAYSSAHCGDSFGCPACYMDQDARLVATCAAEQCKVVDLAVSEVTSCTENGDCRIRANVCCECGAPTGVRDLIAINVLAEADFAEIRCDADQACTECAPSYPAEVMAVCEAGHCQAVWANP
jgi:hypothetical protein